MTDYPEGWSRPFLDGTYVLPGGTKSNGRGSSPDASASTPLSDIVPEKVEWVWPGVLARGKLTLIGGDPEQGKSMFAVDCAARISAAKNFHLGPRAPVGSTLILSAEDGKADTIRPRAEAAGADLTKLFVFESSLSDKDGAPRTFSLAHDLDLLAEAVTKIGDVHLIIIDPVTAYMGKVDSHSTGDVRAVLEPLSRFAEEHRVSVLAVTHPPKANQGNAMRQFTGSFAYVAAARVAFCIVSEPDSDRHLMLGVKNNVGRKLPGRAYSVRSKEISESIEAPYIEWSSDPVDVTADQALADAAAAMRDPKAIEDAEEFLQEQLADGPKLQAEIGKAARGRDIKRRTLRRAKANLGVKSRKGGVASGWLWELPEAKNGGNAEDGQA